MGDFDASASPHGLTIDAVDWLPSGGRSGLVRVRGHRAGTPAGQETPLPELVVEHAGEIHRHSSLPDPRAGREGGAWRGAYVVHADLVQAPEARLWLEFPGGVHIALPRPFERAERAPAAEAGGGEVVDRAVLADRRARRAEAAEQAQARIAREALKAVEVLELRAAQLEERLDAVTAERDALSASVGDRAVPDPELPELRRRLAEAQARVQELQARASVAVPAPAAGSVEEAQRRADRLRDALTTAIGTVGELRLQLHEARVRSRTSEIAHAAEAVRLRVLASERGALNAEIDSLRLGISEAEQLRTIHAAEIERVAARAAGAEAAHTEMRRRFAERVGELREARERIGSLEAELAALRAEVPERVATALEEQERELAARHEQAERESAAREAEAQAALAAARGELHRVQAAARADVERAEAAQARAEAAREMAEAAAAAAGMRARVADVARAAGAAAPAPPQRDEAQALEAELAAARAQLEAQAAQLEAARVLAAAAAEDAAVMAGLTAELDAERGRRREVEAALEAERARTPEPPPVAQELPVRAAEQEQAAAAAPAPPADPERLVADLAAAAEALRARPAPPQAPEPAEEAQDADVPAPFLEGAPEPEPDPEPGPTPSPAPAISSPVAPLPTRVATGRHARDYPSLRGALVKLAHDDAQAAARLLIGLLPAQWRVLEEPVDYDLTIAEAGTYAVTVTAGAAHVRPLSGPRSEAEFHLRTDALTLAEMLAGVGPKPRRFGRAKVSGRTRRARALQPLAAATLSLPEAVRAGARLEPELVLRTLAYAVHPSWTAGHEFTIAHTFTGPDGDETLYITARDGRGLTISHDPPAQAPATTVVLGRDAFEALLRGDAAPPGARPATRGDHRAAQTLRAWADRARAGG